MLLQSILETHHENHKFPMALVEHQERIHVPILFVFIHLRAKEKDGGRQETEVHIC